jgi:hypothetical protein
MMPFKEFTFKIFEDIRMSGACGMWRVGVLLALKNIYIPVCEVESLRRSYCVST